MAELELEDLGDVFEEVFEARSKWYNIGLKLKVPVGSLETIKGENDDAADCLREMLKISLKSISHKLTWMSLGSSQKSNSRRISAGRSGEDEVLLHETWCVHFVKWPFTILAPFCT